MSPAAFASERHRRRPWGGREFARLIFCQHRLFHEPPRGADRVSRDLAVFIRRKIIWRDRRGFVSGRIRTVPRGQPQVTALTVMAGSRGSRSSDSGCTELDVGAIAVGIGRVENAELRRRHG
jgi:hypothetical protein